MSGVDVMRSRVERARTLLPGFLPTVTVEEFDGPANAETKLVPGGVLIQWRHGYPAQLSMPQPNAGDIAHGMVEAEYTADHELGHAIDKLLQARGVQTHVALYKFRGYRGTPEEAAAAANAMGVEAGWSYQPREQFAETMRAAIGGRWIRPERAFNEGRVVDPMAARMWLFGLIGIAAPPPAPATQGGSMKIIDVRSQLPLATQYVPTPSHAMKTSNTVHWTGGHDTITTDEEALAAIKRWHQQHINTDWSPDGGFQGGAGLMYLEVIAPSGTVFITRDPDAVTWHCSDAHGNAHSRPILVICDQDEPPTNQQLASLDSRITFPEFQPHKFWVGTACPGPELVAFIDERRVDDMFTAQDREDLRRIKAQLDAEGPRIWTQRLQDWLSKIFKSLFSGNIDYSGPDVTSGQPRK